MHPFYALILTLMNSIWQSALLLSIYFCLNSFYKNIHPLQKRNFLYSILLVQILLSFTSYFIIKYEIAWSNSLVIQTNWLTKIIVANENLVFYSYLGFILLKLCNIGLQWSTFYFTYKKYVSKPNASLRMYVISHAALMGITREITLLFSTEINTPITFGFFKPVILLPFAVCTQLNTKDIEAIILHELAHIKNKDYLLNWLLLFVEILYVCNPFVHFIIKKIKLEREKNCDTTVIQFKYDNISYAEALLHIAKNATNVKNFQIGFIKNGGQLLQRISFFCNSKNFIFSKTKGLYSTLLLLPIITFFCLPSLQKETKAIVNNNVMLANNTLQTEKWAVPIKTDNIIEETTEAVLAIEAENKIDLLKDEQEVKADKIYIDVKNNTDFKFVSLLDSSQNTKEFIYKVETKDGKIINTYDLKFVNGKWILIPTYLFIQKYADSTYKLELDSAYLALDSLIQ